MLRLLKSVRGRSAVLAVAGLALVASACSSGSSSATASSTSGGQSPTLQHVLSSHVLRVGIAETIPNAWKDTSTNQWEGYNVEVARQLAKALNVNVQFIEAPLNSWIPQLQEGKFDIDMLGWFMTPARAEQVDFTSPVFTKGYSYVVQKNSPIHSLSQLNSPKYSVTGLVGGSEQTVAKQYTPKATPAFITANSPLDAALAVKAGRATAWIYPSDIIGAFLKLNPWARVVNTTPVWNNPLAYAIRKGDPEWKFFLDAFITEIQKSGELQGWIKQADAQAIGALQGNQK